MKKVESMGNGEGIDDESIIPTVIENFVMVTINYVSSEHQLSSESLTAR